MDIKCEHNVNISSECEKCCKIIEKLEDYCLKQKKEVQVYPTEKEYKVFSNNIRGNSAKKFLMKKEIIVNISKPELDFFINFYHII